MRPLWRRAERRARRDELAWLESQYDAAPSVRNFGLCLDRIERRPQVSASGRIGHLIEAAEGKNTILAPALFNVWPSWHWGFQGTGDCVSWGTGHMLDINLSTAFLAGKHRHADALVCQESIYGFGKAELFESYGNHDAGMNGVDAAEACRKFGTLYRIRYPGYDLTEYDGGRAKAWGERPRSTRGVPDALEPFAAEHKATEIIRVDSIKAGAALLESGYAWQYCGYTYWPTRRTSDGMGAGFTSGWHCMTAVGVIYGDDGKPAWWRIANTGHGDHVGGPAEPGGVPAVYQECGGWVPNRLVEPVIRAGDCYCITAVAGWPRLTLPDLGWAGEWL